MFQRGITTDAVRAVVESGVVIEAKPDDLPYPSRLVLGWLHGRPLHVVVADDAAVDVSVIVTVYEPDPALWRSDFRRRRKR
jgi:hypothetical protein